MKNITKILPILLLIILASAFASAEIIINTYEVDYGFSMKTTPLSNYELCSCESYTDYFVVENTGTYASTYEISLTSDYATLSSQEFELLPEESKTIYLFIQGPCDKKVEEQITVGVKDLFGNTQELVKELEVGKCQNLEAELRTENNGTSNPCTPITYDIAVTNTGVFTENYHIEFGGKTYEEYFNFPYQDIVIEAGGKGVVSATMALACSISGNLQIPFSVEAEKNELIAELNHDLTILENYDFEIIAGEAEVCTLKETAVPILINNKANFDNSYTIELKAPKYFTLNTETLTVKAEGSEVFFIKVKPEEKHAGPQEVILTVTEETDGRVVETEVSITIIQCNDVSVNVDLQEDIYDCAGQYEYPVIIKNTGLVNADVRLDVYGSEYITATQSNFMLKAGEEKETAIYANLPPAHALQTDIRVVATILGVEGVTAEDEIHVEYLDEKACFAVALEDEKAKMDFNEEEVTLIMKHLGLKEARYDLSYEGEGFALSDDDERLSPGEEEEIILEKINESEQRVYKGTLRAFTTSEDEERTLIYELPVTINYNKKSIYEKGKEYFTVHPCQFVTLILLVLFIAGALILIIRPDRPRRSGIILFMILLGMWLIAAVIFVAIFGPPQLYADVETSENPLDIIIRENERYILSLEELFIDEDGDSLDYLFSEMDNVSVTIENGTATITPDKDFSGDRRFRITAFDGKGGATESPRMSLEVIDRQEYTGWSFYTQFCGYINLVLLLLVFMTAVRLFRARIQIPKREEEIKRKRVEKKKVSEKPKAKKAKPRQSKKSLGSKSDKKKVAVKRKTAKKVNRKTKKKAVVKKKTSKKTASKKPALPNTKKKSSKNK